MGHHYRPKGAGLRVRLRAFAAALLLICMIVPMKASASEPENTLASRHFLLNDALGGEVKLDPGDVPTSLQPPSEVGLGTQIPTPIRGAPLHHDVLGRILELNATLGAWQWFPATPPVLMPYLGSLDEFGNTAIQPGAVFATDPLSERAQEQSID
jgi:hypothetical protein